MAYRKIHPDVRREALARLATGNESQRTVAQQLGVSPSTVSWWANGGGSGEAGRRHRARCDRLSPWTVLTERPHWAYLFGVYLGDGSIDTEGRLGFFLDEAYPGIISEVDRALRRIGVDRPWHVRKPGCRAIMAGKLGWDRHFPTGRGPKHTYRLTLAPWHSEAVIHVPQVVLRGLLHSDGCRYLNRVRSTTGQWLSYPSYSFNNRSRDVHAIFEACCQRLGLRPTIASGGLTRQLAKRVDVALVDLFVGPKR